MERPDFSVCVLVPLCVFVSYEVTRDPAAVVSCIAGCFPAHVPSDTTNESNEKDPDGAVRS